MKYLLKTRLKSSVLKYPSAFLRLLVGGNSPPVQHFQSKQFTYTSVKIL